MSESAPSSESIRFPDQATSPAASAAAASGASFRADRMRSYFGPAFVASVAYIDPGNFATNLLGGAQFGYRLLWVLLWSNAMAILIQYLSAKLGIVTGRTLPQNCRAHFSRGWTIALWIAAEISAVATDLAEFLGAAMGLDLLLGPALHAHGYSPTATLMISALIATVAVVAILALDLAGYQWLERGIMAFVGAIGLCYGFEVFLVHPDWHSAFVSTLLPRFDPHAMQASVYAAVGMLGATVMPHVIYLHSALVQPRLLELAPPPKRALPNVLRQYLHFELVDVFVAMNGAWLINSAMIVMAAVALFKGPSAQPTIQDAFHTLGPLLGRGAAVVFAVALLCSGLSSSTVGVMAGQVVIEGFLEVKFPIFLRRFITVLPALVVIGMGWDPLRILIGSQVLLSFSLPAALIPLLLLTARKDVMGEFRSGMQTRIAGWIVAGIILALNAVLLVQVALGS
ncbi:MAG: Nramp family divalent metal transporter [Acidobacteriaceae bacterium]|nr:Nramp family divalent metal transporter [Acidobacteriaceae bacterium]